MNLFLDDQLSWRKRELTTIRAIIQKSRRHETDIIIRSAICLLYAHWEGFVSNAAKAYVSYVVLQNFRLRDLTPNFIALGLRSDIQEAGRSNKPILHTQLTEKVLNGSMERFRVDWETAITTSSNLKIDVLSEILCVLGIDPKIYMARKPIIDQRLVDNRNIIAHGGRPAIAEDEYETLHEDVMQLIEWIRTDIENAAISDKHRRST